MRAVAAPAAEHGCLLFRQASGRSMASFHYPGPRRFEQPFLLAGVVDPWRLPGGSIATPAIATDDCSTLRPAVPGVAC